MIPKAFEEITEADITSLIENEVPEGRQIEYKLLLPGNNDEAKREFLADVSSFANASGGDLLYGIKEDDGKPVATTGLADINTDADVLRFENILRDGLDPRVSGLRMQTIDGFSKGPILVVRVPNSWASPHMVTFKNYSRFFTRNSAGKYQMDVTEIRSAFALSESLRERIARFRDGRLGKIIAGDTPVLLGDVPKIVLHVLPVSAFARNVRLALSVVDEQRSKMLPISGSATGERYNVDGFVRYCDYGSDSAYRYDYCQLFRNGIIEAVNTEIICLYDGEKNIPSVDLEVRLVYTLQSYLSVYQRFDIQPPIVVMLSIIGAKGYEMGVDMRLCPAARLASHDATVIDRDMLILPDVLIQEYPPEEALRGDDVNDIARILHPIFDAVWNAAGWPRSMYYNGDENWKVGK
ncbi:MAG: ATP-binding protein [Phycisphaerae bacterium]|nr:ATP-binding protein [Planctomycetota bacterium]MBL7220032.1 ATP-binding protein [Phycisphaerae bacterium]